MTDSPSYRHARKGRPVNRGKLVSEAEFRRMWFDPALRLVDIAARLGVHKTTVSQRARTRRLPPRAEAVGCIRPGRRIHEPELALSMYRFGVSVAAICSHFGVKRGAFRSLRERCAEPGRVKRGQSHASRRTVAEFFGALSEDLLAKRLARDAARVGVQWRLADMVDAPRRQGQNGVRAA